MRQGYAFPTKIVNLPKSEVSIDENNDVKIGEYDLIQSGKINGELLPTSDVQITDEGGVQIGSYSLIGSDGLINEALLPETGGGAGLTEEQSAKLDLINVDNINAIAIGDGNKYAGHNSTAMRL